MGMDAKKRDQRYFSRYTETKEETRQRLLKNKEIGTNVRQLKEEIHFKTGNEFSYKMHSIRTENEKLFQIEKFTKTGLKQKLLQINYEIIRIEKKLTRMTPIYNSTRLKFGKNCTFKRITQKQELKSNTKRILVHK